MTGKLRPTGLPSGYHIMEHGNKFVLCRDDESEDEQPVFPTIQDCINQARYLEGLE